MINKIIYFFVFALNFINLNAQVKENESEIFKMQLFLNRKAFVKNNDDSLSNLSSSYKIFSDLFILQMNELKVENKLSGVLGCDYVFYEVIESEIKRKRELSSIEYKYLDFECYPANKYILAINLKTGLSYRLSGFETNDFISFFIDFKSYYLNRKLNIKTFLNDFKVENLDFECMYKGLNIKKMIHNTMYPCLKKCSDLLKIN